MIACENSDICRRNFGLGKSQIQFSLIQNCLTLRISRFKSTYLMLAKIYFGKTYFRGEQPDTSSLKSISKCSQGSGSCQTRMRGFLWKICNSCYYISNKVTSCCNGSLTCYIDAWSKLKIWRNWNFISIVTLILSRIVFTERNCILKSTVTSQPSQAAEKD